MRCLLLLLACNHDPLSSPALDGGADFARDVHPWTTCDSQLWTIECCPGGPECAACQVPQRCDAISADCCPNDRCQLLTDCSGNRVCYNRFAGTPPACGAVGYYGQDVACCAGLVKRCGAPRSDGTCDTTAGYNHLPQCLPCGDGQCDFFENSCNCPEDCP